MAEAEKTESAQDAFLTNIACSKIQTVYGTHDVDVQHPPLTEVNDKHS